ncbi:MAG: sigma-70 family RNA polymerase sigma factor [Eubacteriales bacterium]
MGYPQKDENHHLIIKYMPLVKKVVARIEVNEWEFSKDDLVSIGVIGLMDAIKKYDPAKAVPFEAYAILRIKGTILDELRKSGRVSRDKIAKLNEYYAAKEALEQKLLRNPKESEICQELGIGNKELFKLHETVHYLSRISFESTVFSREGKDIQLVDFIKDDKSTSPEQKYIKKEERTMLIEAISTLKEREKMLLNLYYVDELTLKEIAYIMELSIPRISQIHGKILMKLRSSLEQMMKGKK